MNDFKAITPMPVRLSGAAISIVLAAVLVGSTGALAQDEAAELPWSPEETTVTLGYQLPSLNSVAPLLVAQDRGFWQDCGLENVELIQTEEVTSGVVSGSLDVGILETNDAGQAQVDDLPVKVISAYRPWGRNIIAVHPSIETPADLAGKDILLGGTPGTLDFDFRMGLLSEAGYDLEGVAFNPVSVEGGSDAWVALLEEGRLYLTPVFNRHYQRLQDQGFEFWVDRFDFGNEHIITNEGFLASNPDAAAAFLCGLIQGFQVWADTANRDYVLGLGEAYGIEIDERITAAYDQDILQYRPWTGGWPMEDMAAYLEALVTPEVPGDVDLDDLLALDPLHRAQEFLGLEPDPVLDGMGSEAQG